MVNEIHGNQSHTHIEFNRTTLKPHEIPALPTIFSLTILFFFLPSTFGENWLAFDETRLLRRMLRLFHWRKFPFSSCFGPSLPPIHIYFILAKCTSFLAKAHSQNVHKPLGAAAEYSRPYTIYMHTPTRRLHSTQRQRHTRTRFVFWSAAHTCTHTRASTTIPLLLLSTVPAVRVDRWMDGDYVIHAPTCVLCVRETCALSTEQRNGGMEGEKLPFVARNAIPPSTEFKTHAVDADVNR